MYLIRSAYMGKQNISTLASPGRAFYFTSFNSNFLFPVWGIWHVHLLPPTSQPEQQHLPGAVWPIR